MTFRTRLFLTSLLAAAVALLVATALVSWSVRRNAEARIERGLVNEARLAAETLSHRQVATAEDLDAEADAIGRLVSARVTFVAPDGTVVGDSELTAAELRTLENHAGRPEIQEARASGIGIERRYSATLHTDMLYVAVPVHGAAAPLIADVRLALPMTEVTHQLAAIRRAALAAIVAGLLVALALAWQGAAMIGRRVQAIAGTAERYAAGDLAQTRRDDEADELGVVARDLDEAVRELGNRAMQRETDRARLQEIVNGMNEGVLVVNPQGRMELVNNAGRRMLRLTDPPEGRHYLEVVRHPDIAGQISGALHGVSSPGLELTFSRDPETIFVARGAPVASTAGRGVVLVLHDITDLRRTDQIRRDFVANVSHELRTPLTAVRGYVEALIDGAEDPAEGRRFLETIARHTLRMERLVTDLLRLARLDAGQEPLERVACTVESLFSGVTTELADAIEGREQEVVVEIAPDAAIVQGDPAKLHDALRNLLENATNYAPDGSRIVMGSTRVKDRVILTVADSGPGIPEADLPRVFERFYRVDKARSRSTRDPGGTGLGLAIVKHLIGVHGGTVAVANRPEGGAVFTIALPE
ncbi:MAG: ATP-binding protein [Acidobacteriota bacterium]